MRRVKQGDTVKIHYTGRLENGTVFDTTVDRGPLQVSIGNNQMPSGFDQALIGMHPGERKKIEVDADRHLDPRYEAGAIAIDRRDIPDGVDLRVGQKVELRQPDGRALVVKVHEIGESEVVLETTHFVADKKLTFEVELVEIV